jgi:hypothetical protein
MNGVSAEDRTMQATLPAEKSLPALYAYCYHFTTTAAPDLSEFICKVVVDKDRNAIVCWEVIGSTGVKRLRSPLPVAHYCDFSERASIRTIFFPSE